MKFLIIAVFVTLLVAASTLAVEQMRRQQTPQPVVTKLRKRKRGR
jgi:hypothetical protein